MIFISAGHNQKRQGASFNNFTEWTEAMKWRDAIFAILGSSKATPVPPISIYGKVEFINSNMPKDGKHIAVEIHFNSAVNSHGNHVGRGSETLYCPGSVAGKHIAEYVQESIRFVWPPSRGVKEGWYQMNPAKGPDYFLKATHCPAIIVEPEFVHNGDMIVERRDVGCRLLAEALLSLCP